MPLMSLQLPRFIKNKRTIGNYWRLLLAVCETRIRLNIKAIYYNENILVDHFNAPLFKQHKGATIFNSQRATHRYHIIIYSQRRSPCSEERIGSGPRLRTYHQ